MAEQIQKSTTRAPKAPEVIEPMPVTTDSETTVATADVLADLDQAIAAASAAGDDALLSAVRSERVQTVASTGWSAFQSAESRAWTMGGQVD